MGLFDAAKKALQGSDCVLCGNKAGLVLNYKLKTGQVICSNCRENMSEYVISPKFLTLDEVKEHIELKKKNDEKYENKFKANLEINFDENHKLFEMDSERGEFVCLKEKKPTVFRFSQVTSYGVKLHTMLMNDNDRKRNAKLGNMLKILKDGTFKKQFPDMPQAQMGYKIIGMYFVVTFGENPLRCETMQIDILPSWSHERVQLEKGYTAGADIFRVFQERLGGEPESTSKLEHGGTTRAVTVQVEQSGEDDYIDDDDIEPIAPEAAGGEAVAEEPAAQENVAEEPAVEEPVAKEPVAEEPAVENTEHNAKASASAGDTSLDLAIEQVKKLKELLDIGALTQEEFDLKKKELLNL